MTLRLFAMVVALVVLASASLAQTPGGRDPEGVLVDELVVNGGPSGGPAFWIVSDADSKVFILGAPAALPKGLRWDPARLQARLKGANSLILPPSVRVSPFRALAFFLKERRSFQSPARLEDTLPAPLRPRFAAARQGLGKTADRYAKWRAAAAAVFLAGDFRGAARLQIGEPQNRARSLGRAAGVRERRVATYDALPLLKELSRMPDEAQRLCLADTVAEVEAGISRVRTAAEGWARGDVRAALTAERGYDRCLAATPAISALLERGQADTAAVIAESLQAPGKSVAVVELRPLLARGGVLDRLRARGYHVQTPD